MPHSLTDFIVHVIFSTKDRRPFLDDDLKPRLFAYIKATVQERRARLHNINGSANHVHLLLSLPTTVALADLMRHVKGGSSHWVRQEFQDRQNFAWQDGFAAFSVSHSRLKRASTNTFPPTRRSQEGDVPRGASCLLKKHEIAYDERYLQA